MSIARPAHALSPSTQCQVRDSVTQWNCVELYPFPRQAVARTTPCSVKPFTRIAAGRSYCLAVSTGATAMPQDWWTRKSLIYVATVIVLAFMGFIVMGVSHPE